MKKKSERKKQMVMSTVLFVRVPRLKMTYIEEKKKKKQFIGLQKTQNRCKDGKEDLKRYPFINLSKMNFT